jgi:hypothetical protein
MVDCRSQGSGGFDASREAGQPETHIEELHVMDALGRVINVLLLAIALLAIPSGVRATTCVHQGSQLVCESTTKHVFVVHPSGAKSSTQVDSQRLTNTRYYTNVDGKVIHSPANLIGGGVPQGATAKCLDGTYSFSQHHQGTCSHHGGVDSWL